jgi:predicted alpha/beta-fold hydrolase
MTPPYRAPPWLPGGHLQTLWPALLSRPHAGAPVRYRRERWATPDGDFVDVDFLDPAAAPTADATAPLLVLLHGLEGSSRSGYALAFADWARGAGWAYAVPHFRGCSGEPNLAPRAYHSGDHAEVGWLLARLRARHGRPLHAVGVSLGGNALLRWAEEAGAAAGATVAALAAVCAPLDLQASGLAIGRGLNGWLYTPHFLRSMKPKALAQWQRHPGLFDRERVARARTLYEFDDAYTAPLHGFAGVLDYWQRASAKPQLARIGVPALLLNPRNDPFVPASSLPAAHEVGPAVTLWQPAHGGHVGFAGGPPPGHLGWLPQAVMAWLHAQRP